MLDSDQAETVQPEAVEIDLTVPYITANLPGIGGTLRATPDHFVVEELPLYDPQGDGQHVYINLTKTGLTTREVQGQLAKLFKVTEKQVGFAGMKDKYARTTQTFSVNVGFMDEEGVAAVPQRVADALPVTVHWAKLHRNKLKIGHLIGNRFTITVTGMGMAAADALPQAQAIADELLRTGLPNYYGPQRLGVDGDNVRRGLALLQGKRYIKDRWLRRLMISSYQSYLCNRYLTERVERGLFEQILTGDVAKKYATGGMFQVEDAEVEQPRFAAQEITFTAPVYGPKMWDALGPAGELEAAVWAESPVTVEHFAKARIQGTRRIGRLLVPDLTVQAGEDDDTLVVQFSLLKGSYATTVLGEIMKVDLTHIPDAGSDEGE